MIAASFCKFLQLSNKRVLDVFWREQGYSQHQDFVLEWNLSAHHPCKRLNIDILGYKVDDLITYRNLVTNIN